MKLAAPAVDALLRQAAETAVPGVVAAVTDRHGLLYEAAFGRASSSPYRPMQTDSIVRIASMTKIVTSLAVMMLCEEQGISLDASLIDHLPGYRQPGVIESFDASSLAYRTREAATRISIRQLLSHTSGYGYWFLDERLLKLTTGTPELFNPPFLIAEPGAQFAYSTSTDVLGQLVAALAGVSLAEFFAARIFAPLAMPDTSFELPPDDTRLVSVHARRGAQFEELGHETIAPEPRGGGGLYSTAADYLKLLRLFMNGGETQGRRLLSQDGIAAMILNQIGPAFAERQRSALPERSNDFIFMDGSQKFGLGFMIETRDRAGGRAAGSLSWAGIANTYFWLDPCAGIAAVLLMQTTPFADPVCVDLLERFERSIYAALL
jgi:CubicO group peptidase (beta-lactamase class C family)